MADIPVRRPLLLKTALEVLRDSEAKLSRSQLSGEVSRRLDLTAYELAAPEGGSSRYNHAFGRLSSGVAKVGWVSKLGGWSITDAGIPLPRRAPPGVAGPRGDRRRARSGERRGERLPD